jgi:hypothetical protein
MLKSDCSAEGRTSHARRARGSSLTLGEKHMNLRIAFASILAIIACHSACAHQDRIIRLSGEKLEGLPPKYLPASFSIKDRQIVLGPISVVVPECIWKRFGSIKEEDLRFQASWYHDPSILPPYIIVSIGKVQGKTGYELLLNLDSLAVISFKKAMVEPDGTSYEDIPIGASCASDWKVVRKQ